MRRIYRVFLGRVYEANPALTPRAGREFQTREEAVAHLLKEYRAHVKQAAKALVRAKAALARAEKKYAEASHAS